MWNIVKITSRGIKKEKVKDIDEVIEYFKGRLWHSELDELKKELKHIEKNEKGAVIEPIEDELIIYAKNIKEADKLIDEIAELAEDRMEYLQDKMLSQIELESLE